MQRFGVFAQSRARVVFAQLRQVQRDDLSRSIPERVLRLELMGAALLDPVDRLEITIVRDEQLGFDFGRDGIDQLAHGSSPH